MSTRKRPRAALHQEALPHGDDDDEQDELSPRKSELRARGVSTNTGRLDNSNKKRRLNAAGASGGGSSAGVLAGIRRTAGTLIGGLFGGHGEVRRGDGDGDGDETVDELAADEGVVNGRGKGKGRRRDVFDFPESDDDGDRDTNMIEASSKRKSIGEKGVNGKKIMNGGSVRSRQKARADVWDVPESDDELGGRIGRRLARVREKMNGSSPAMSKSAQSSATKANGRTGYDQGKVNGKKRVESPGIEIAAGADDGTPEPRMSGRARKISSRLLDHLAEGADSSPQPASGSRNGKTASPMPIAQPDPQSSVKRKRGRPRKNLDSVIADAKKGTPKGILTPSKGGTLRTKKSVAFEGPSDEIDLGFKDIPKSASAKKPQSAPAQQKGDENDKKDPACKVCSKKHSRKGNEMLFCDGCDFPVHLKCYGLSAVPDGDWFCKTCQPDQDMADVDDEEQEDEPGDAACGVCSKKHSRGGNEIIFCDECDFAVHLKCYDLASVPGGDWYCKSCRKEDPSIKVDSTPKKAVVKGANASEADETACAMCFGLDSTAGNKIIICDGCEVAVHVKCYELPEFPRGDWYCRTCLAAAGEDPFNLGVADETTVEEAQSDGPDIEGLEKHLRRAQRIVLDRLTGNSRVKIVGYDDEMQKVHQVVEQTVLAGEGNSMLVIGARGCGKTTLVESVIADLSVDHREKFHVVRLNGFIHTDDKTASKEIWRQLGREMEIEDDKPTNYADTLASLLALLSHPAENSDSVQSQTTKSVVFVLDEFDLFTTHSRQTLLYNLFDIAQASRAPIVVLGVTTRIDVVESLEKRVKSRFSHRYVHLSLPRSVLAFWQVCKEALSLQSEDFLDEDIGAPGQSEFLSYWDSMIEDLFTKDPVFKHHLQSNYYRDKSIPSLLTSLLLPLASLTPTTLPLSGKKITSSPNLQPPDSKLHILPSLSQLSLALLIAAARLDIIHDTDTCNFAMAYDEYCALTSKHKIQTSASGVNAIGGAAKVWGREVAMGEWEGLSDVGLLLPAGFGAGGGAARDGGKAGRMWKVDVGLEEIEGSVELSSVMTKWCREI